MAGEGKRSPPAACFNPNQVGSRHLQLRLPEAGVWREGGSLRAGETQPVGQRHLPMPSKEGKGEWGEGCPIFPGGGEGSRGTAAVRPLHRLVTHALLTEVPSPTPLPKKSTLNNAGCTIEVSTLLAGFCSDLASPLSSYLEAPLGTTGVYDC